MHGFYMFVPLFYLPGMWSTIIDKSVIVRTIWIQTRYEMLQPLPNTDFWLFLSSLFFQTGQVILAGFTGNISGLVSVYLMV